MRRYALPANASLNPYPTKTGDKFKMENSPKILILLIASVGLSNALAAPGPESSDEKLKKYEAIFKQCRYDPKSVSAAEKECVIRETNKLEGKGSFREAYCQRQADTYENFAKARDTGATLNSSLKALDQAAPEIVSKIASTSGTPLDGKQIIDEAKQVMRYVYAHPDKSPKLLGYDQYFDCLSKKQRTN